jgi:uncharacterized protein (TIGR00730 family)
MNISVFGGSEPKPGDTSYEEAYLLGKLLGQAGHMVITGGYVGTMEAASRGAAEAGAHVVGVTCSVIEHWRKVGANPWVKEERRFETLFERLVELVTACDAAIALPGGVGTLVEVSLLWNNMLIEALPQKPLILVGNGWREVIATLFYHQGKYIRESHQKLVSFVNTVEEAAASLPPASNP